MNNLREPSTVMELCDFCLAGLQAIESSGRYADPDTLEKIMATAERIIDRQRQENPNG